MTERRTVLVTGAASGIGAGLAERLAEDGDTVFACDVSDAADERHVDSDTVVRRRLDVRDPAQWRDVVGELVQRHGRLDVLCNVAGTLMPGHVGELPDEEVDHHIDVNAKGVIHGTNVAAAHMLPHGRGHIVNVASLAGLSPAPGLALYAASKWAVVGFSLSAALELRKAGIAVSCVCPDAVRTPMLDLQLDYPEAALTFSGGHQLSVDEIVGKIAGEVLERRAPLLSVPRQRGGIAKFGALFPRGARLLHPVMVRVGRRRQARMKAVGR
jgi:3-oxoacyl-[acyl-carrier protein] reductase